MFESMEKKKKKKRSAIVSEFRIVGAHAADRALHSGEGCC